MTTTVRKEINVLDFGAIGDGATDDRAAIQLACDTAGPGGTVYFPPLTYYISYVAGDGINLNGLDGITLRLDDATLRSAPAPVGYGKLIHVDNADDVTIIGGKFDAGVTPTSEAFPNPYVWFIFLSAGKRCTIQGSEFTNMWIAIRSFQTVDLRILDCKFSVGQAMQLYENIGTTVSRCVATDIPYGNFISALHVIGFVASDNIVRNVGRMGIEVIGLSGSGLTTESNTISGNTLENMGYMPAATRGWYPISAIHASITGNSIRNCSHAGIESFASTVVGNKIVDPAGYGILCARDPGGTTLHRPIVVSGNSIDITRVYGFGAPAYMAGNAVNNTTDEETLIAANTIVFRAAPIALNGIRMTQPTSKGRVVDNSILFMETNGNCTGIVVRNTNTISGNHIEVLGTATGVPTLFGIGGAGGHIHGNTIHGNGKILYGIGTFAAAVDTYLKISDNVVRGTTGAGVYLQLMVDSADIAVIDNQVRPTTGVAYNYPLLTTLAVKRNI